MPQIPTEFWNQVGVVLESIVAIMTATLVAFWVGMAIWTFRDIRARTRDAFAWILAVLLVLVTGPVGVLLYLLLRPRETLATAYDRQLEEEALLRDIQARRACPGCQTVTEPEWLMCPHCRIELRRSCEYCQRPLELDWVVCPYCTTEVVFSQPAARAHSGATLPAPAMPMQPVPVNGTQVGSEVADDASGLQAGQSAYS
jgi:RNA polymerase subunit RPABC4/transcription elongation factor Spt4